MSISPSAPPAPSPSPGKRTTTVRRVLAAMALASGAMSALLAGNAYHQHQHLEAEARQAAAAESGLAAHSINQTLAPIVPAVRALADQMGSSHADAVQIAARLREVVEGQYSFVSEAGVAFLPYAFRPDIELFAPHYLRQNGIGRLYQRESLGDYRQREWYRSPLVRGPGWSEPELGHASGELVVGISAPFYDQRAGTRSKAPLGVVRINTSVDVLKDIAAGLTAGRTRYGYLLSAGATYVSHPIDFYVQKQRSAFEIATAANNGGLRECTRQALAGGRGTTDGVSELTGKQAWIFCEPVPINDWVVVMVYEKDELLLASRFQRQQQLLVLLGVLLTAVLGVCFVLRVDERRVTNLWIASFLMSLLLVGGLALIWNELRSTRMTSSANSEIFDRATLRVFESQHATKVQGAKAVETSFVPTGVFISTLNLSKPGEVGVTGYLWQRYRRGPLDALSRGFILPDAEQSTFQEAYRRTEGNDEVIGWSFRATLRQSFSEPSKYPFDGAALRLRLWHKDFDKAVLLVPDLDAYTLMIPGSLPGLEERISLPGWTIQQSYFDFSPTALGADFGMRSFSGRVDAPELCFNIVAKRQFLDPFFASLMPLAVVDCILFVLLLCARRDDKERDRFGFKPMTALSVAAGTLFVILVAHNNMRARVAANELIFLEFFYFLSYATIILVAANAILVTRVRTLHWIHSSDNLAPKVAFWPVTLAGFLAVTIAVFY